MLKKLSKDNRGQAVAEYGLLIALIVVALVAGVVAFRNQLESVFSSATAAMQTK